MPLIIAWILDLVLGDPIRLPHPVVLFGKAIAFCDRKFNLGKHKKLKGIIATSSLIIITFAITFTLNLLLSLWSPVAAMIFQVIIIFYCLAGTTLIREVREVFRAVDRSLEDGRKQVGRIVGRDTSELSAHEIRTAALETLAENLSDGVIAPLFWLAIGGVPAMLTYKMVNTLDSMIGYKTEKHKEFGCFAARFDDVANFIPARLTALLMVISSGKLSLLRFVAKYGSCHASPNSGYPEAALAGILNCRFGGPHYYFGQLFPKPYIGTNDRPLTSYDMKTSVRINRISETIMVILVATLSVCFNGFF